MMLRNTQFMQRTVSSRCQTVQPLDTRHFTTLRKLKTTKQPPRPRRQPPRLQRHLPKAHLAASKANTALVQPTRRPTSMQVTCSSTPVQEPQAGSKVYSGSAWQLTIPSSSDQTNIDTVAGIQSDVTAVAGKALKSDDWVRQTLWLT